MDNKEYLKQILPKLAAKMPYQWRVQSFHKTKCEATCVAYIDARDVMDRLDQVCEYGWERSHTEYKNHLYAGVSIVMPDGSKLTRWDCGTESNTEAEKGESSDSFKRAAVNWGVGRFLYDLKILKVDSNVPKSATNVYPDVVDSSGKKVWNITDHCNAIYDKKNPEQDDKKEEKKVPETPKAPEAPKAEPKPPMTEEQKETIRKHTLLSHFTEEQKTMLTDWISRPQTFENAKARIAKNELIIIEKNTSKQPVTA